MNTCPDKIVHFMHEFLDDELPEEQERELHKHLAGCKACAVHFEELKKTIALIEEVPVMKAPSDFTKNVMQGLPKQEKKKGGMHRFLQRYPLLIAAAVFLVLMGTSLMASWNDGSEFAVTAESDVLIEGNTVIVPAGEVVEGDILVRNGDVMIEGEVDGDVTVINGDPYLAGAGNITGEIEEVDQAFEWLWYKIKNAFADFAGMFQGEEGNE